MPDAVLSAPWAVSQLDPETNLCEMHCCPHLKDGESEAQGG